MRAIVHDRYGGPEVLRFADVPQPTPKRGEILVRVIAASVNRTDIGFRKGEPWIVRFWSGLRRPKNPILGNELVGEVVAVGPEVTRFAPGQEICGLLGDAFGAHAEYVSIPADAPIVRKPAGLRPEEAAALWDGPWLALACLRHAGVAQGQRVLVYGASGSIGTSAVQLAKHLGARVTAVCTAKAVELVRSLGADEVIDYTSTDFTKIEGGFDAVVDAVGKSTFGACRRLLKAGGVFISTDFGPRWQIPVLQLWTTFAGDEKVKLAIPDSKRAREDIQFLSELVEAKELRPVVDRTYPFAEIVEAHRYVETEQKIGSVVILIGAPATSA